jgi:alpha-glucan phosphorylase-like protein
MWQSLWPDREVSEVPIGHVTNGVHPTFWAAPESRALWDRYLPGWREQVWDSAVWAKVEAIPDEELWALKATLRKQLVDLVATRSGTQLDPNALTIGFARRFAPYKRGDLLFSDVARIRALLEQGVQVVYSGKAHPQDRAGREIIAEVLRWTSHRDFRNRVAFIEDYDMAVGRALTSGADVWLNNPRRPQEASGTSGQKVPLNAGINLSVLDGWWPEAFDGTNGWAIGSAQSLADTAAQDAADAASLYALLEGEVLREWKQRDARGLPAAWIKRMRRSIATCGPLFTSHRMVRDYVTDIYAPVMGAAKG